MSELTYEDVVQYEKLFTLTPPFLLERFAKKNTNLVSKFESRVNSFLANISDTQKGKLEILLNSEIDDLQSLMAEAYEKRKKKQYKILANPKYREFIESNLNEVKELVEE